MVKSESEDCYEISAYKDPLTPEGLVKATKKLVTAFPAITTDFIDILSDRIKHLSIGDSQLMDMVNNTIDTCPYPNPTIANLISYRKNIKIYDYHQILRLNDREYHGKAFHYFKRVNIEGVDIPLYAHIQDIEKYKLDLSQPPKDESTKG